jgi:hypothetical protein
VLPGEDLVRAKTNLMRVEAVSRVLTCGFSRLGQL